MKRAGTLLLALALAAAGCVELPKQPSMKAPAPAAPEPPPVRPEQVNDGNARQALDALRNELDHAAEEPAPMRTPEPGTDR